MAKVVILDFHFVDERDPIQMLELVALALVDANVLQPGDTVRIAFEGVGYEVRGGPLAFNEPVPTAKIKEV